MALEPLKLCNMSVYWTFCFHSAPFPSPRVQPHLWFIRHALASELFRPCNDKKLVHKPLLNYSVQVKVYKFQMWMRLLNAVQPIITVRIAVAARQCFDTSLWFCSQGGSGRHPPADTPPRQTPLPQVDGHCSGRYASDWNAFLFSKRFTH